MKTINLTNSNLIAVVDDDQESLVLTYTWRLDRGGYARASSGKKRNETVLMHRLITGAVPGDEVDHVNRNKLDNRTENLRLVSRVHNQWNRTARSDNTSGVPGVSFNKTTGKWEARIKVHYKRVHLGSFKEKTDAIAARMEGEREFHGEYSPNVPQPVAPVQSGGVDRNVKSLLNQIVNLTYDDDIREASNLIHDKAKEALALLTTTQRAPNIWSRFSMDLIRLWAKAQGFETWLDDHKEAVYNMERWITRNGPEPIAPSVGSVPTVEDLAVEIYVADGYTRELWEKESPGFKQEHIRRSQAIHALLTSRMGTKP